MNPSCPFAKSLNDWKQEVNQRDVDRRKSAAATIGRVSVQGVKSLWGDCMFIPADWGSQYVVDLCYFDDFSL